MGTPRSLQLLISFEFSKSSMSHKIVLGRGSNTEVGRRTEFKTRVYGNRRRKNLVSLLNCINSTARP